MTHIKAKATPINDNDYNCYRAATHDVTSVMKSLPWGKTVSLSYEKGAFSSLYVC